MGSDWPERLVVDSHQLTVLRAVLAAVAPQEGCALLLGHPAGAGAGDQAAARLQLIWPCLNVWPQSEQRCERFAIDPREQLMAQKWGRQRGWQVLGTAHSHPSSAAIPSPTDCAWAFTPALMLILGASGELRAWWIAELPGDSSALPAAREVALVPPALRPSAGGEHLGE
jgi:proteasome lid subunit RPN8/RPN11